MLLDVTRVVARENFSLLLELENGERRYFGMPRISTGSRGSG